jgi:hypothetical protein
MSVEVPPPKIIEPSAVLVKFKFPTDPEASVSINGLVTALLIPVEPPFVKLMSPVILPVRSKPSITRLAPSLPMVMSIPATSSASNIPRVDVT